MDDVIAVVTDLFFQSKISSVARATGHRVRYITSSDAAHGHHPLLVLVDLDARLDVNDVIRRLSSSTRAPVVAFGPHLDTEKFKAARAAGASRVLAKSKFVTELPHIMKNLSGLSENRQAELEASLAELWTFGKRMQELGQLLQDPEKVGHIYFAPSPDMEAARAHGEPIILDSADYLGFLAVNALQPKIERVRDLQASAAEGASST